MREAATGRALTNDLQIHLLQLNHLQVTAETVYHASSAERWAYFLLNADQLTAEEVGNCFDQEFAEAAGVLEMIARTPEQLMAYHARLKFQLDEIASEGDRLCREEARREGEAIGEAKGVEIGEARGRVAVLQELLGSESGLRRSSPTVTRPNSTRWPINFSNNCVLEMPNKG